MKVRCTEQLPTKAMTFRAGEVYVANKINNDWYAVDSVGVGVEDVSLHFEIIEDDLTEEEASARMDQDPHQTRVMKWAEPEIPIVPGLWDEDEDEEIKETWWDRLMAYIFV